MVREQAPIRQITVVERLRLCSGRRVGFLLCCWLRSFRAAALQRSGEQEQRRSEQEDPSRAEREGSSAGGEAMGRGEVGVGPEHGICRM